MNEILKRASRGAGATRELYRQLTGAQKVSLFLVTGLVALALSSVALSGSEPPYIAVATAEDGTGRARLDDLAVRLSRASIPSRERRAPGGARTIEVPAASFERARAVLDAPGGAAPSAPDWPFQSSGFWESDSKFGEKLRDFNRQRIEQAILWNPKIQAASVVLSRAQAPRHARDRAAGDSASVTVHLKSGFEELLQKEADAIRAMVEGAFDLEARRVSITDNFFRSYNDARADAAGGSGVLEAGDRWRRRIRDDVTEYYANYFDASGFHVAVIVHVSSEQSSIVKEEFDPERSLTKPVSTRIEREEGGRWLDGAASGGLMSASAAAVPSSVVRESTEEMTWVARQHTLTEIPPGVLRGASVSVLVDLAALERMFQSEAMLRGPAAPGGEDGESWSFASVSPGEREALIAGFIDREEGVLRSFLSAAGESNVKVIVGAFARGGRARAGDEAAPALLASAPSSAPAAPPARGGWGTAAVGAGLIGCMAACALAIARRLARRSRAGDAGLDRAAGGERAFLDGRGLARAPGFQGILRTVSETSAIVRERPEVAASVLRFWLSQDAEDARAAAAGKDLDAQAAAPAPPPAGAVDDRAGGEERGGKPPGGRALPGFSGASKAAVFILSLEEEVASLLLRSLSDADLGRITAEIAELGVVDNDTVARVIREYTELERLHGMVREGGLHHAIRLVERSFPREKARRVVDLLAEHRQTFPFSFLEDVEIETLMSCLADEHPQTLAVVLAHMMPGKAAEIVERLDPALRRDVLERIAGLEGANAEALEDLEQSLRKHLDAVRFEALGEGGGVKALAEILRAADGEGRALLDDLRVGRPDLAEEVGRHLFVFDDIVRLDDRALQSVLKETDAHRLALALKNASHAVRARVLDNVSRRTAEVLEEEMDHLGPVRLAEVDAARRGILETVLRLEEAGHVYISGRGREENRIVY